MALIRLLLASLLLVASPAAAQTFPKFTGLVTDAADVLSPAQEQALTAELMQLQRDTKRQLVVATIPDLQGYPLEDYGYRLGRAWGVGLRDVNNGVVLFVAPNERPGQRGPRIEVGSGLEGIVTDAFAERTIREQMMPRLRGGDVPGALAAGTDALVQQLRSSPEEAGARTDAAAREFDRTHRRSGNGDGGGVPFGLIFLGIVAAVVLVPMIGARGRRGVSGDRYRRRRGGGIGEAIGDNLPIILWTAANVLGSGSRSGGSGGSSGGDGGGGWTDGGFSGGGGGSFGGGGASGEW